MLPNTFSVINHRSNKFLLKHLVIKTSDKKYERRFDRSTVILKFKFTK